jgi:hypothetical protein
MERQFCMGMLGGAIGTVAVPVEEGGFPSKMALSWHTKCHTTHESANQAARNAGEHGWCMGA